MGQGLPPKHDCRKSPHVSPGVCSSFFRGRHTSEAGSRILCYKADRRVGYSKRPSISAVWLFFYRLGAHHLWGIGLLGSSNYLWSLHSWRSAASLWFGYSGIQGFHWDDLQLIDIFGRSQPNESICFRVLWSRDLADRVRAEGSQQFFSFLEVGCHFLFSSLVLIVDLENNELGVTKYF